MKNYIKDQENWLDYSVSGFWLTVDGVKADLNSWLDREPTNNIQISGTCLITKDKVYRPSQYVFIGETWPEAIAYYKQNRKQFESVGVNLKVDFEDYDCCADGHITFKNHSDDSFVMTSVPFNRDIHNYVTSLLK